MDPDLLAAIESGELTQAQLRELIAYQGGLMGLDYATTVERGIRDDLPNTALGSDTELLCRLLDAVQ